MHELTLRVDGIGVELHSVHELRWQPALEESLLQVQAIVDGMVFVDVGYGGVLRNGRQDARCIHHSSCSDLRVHRQWYQGSKRFFTPEAASHATRSSQRHGRVKMNGDRIATHMRARQRLKQFK